MLTACGTSWHAALVGEYLIEALARMPVEVEYASELRYRNPPLDDNTLLFAITQSGETADTLAALREMKRKGHPTLAICNVVGSTIAQEADGGIYLHAGPEIGVASTKAFTSQCTVLAMLALYFGRLHHLSFDAGMRIIEQLQELPDKVAAGPGDQRPGPARSPRSTPTATTSSTWAGSTIPDGPGRRAEAQGDQLHPRRGLPGRRDEARPDRPGRRAHAQRVPHAAGAGLRQGDGQPAGDQGPRRPGDRRGRRGRHARSAELADDVIEVPGRRRLPPADRHRSSPCSCWPTTSPSPAAATSTSRATWPRA